MDSNIINKSNFTLLRIILAFIGWFTLTESANCSTKCVSSDNGCRVCFDECTKGNVTTYNFDSCTQKLFSPNAGSSQDKNETTTLTYNLAQCGTHCCNDEFVIFQNAALKSCPALSVSQTQITIIVISVLTVVFVALCCVVSGNPKIRQKFIKWLCKDRSRKDRHAVDHHSFSLANSISELAEGEQKGRKTPMLAKEEVCSICLEGNNNVKTRCGHPYHFKCIYEWVTRRPQCPLCKEDVARVWLHCQRCLVGRADVAVLEVPFLQVKSMESYECGLCKKE